MDVQSKWPVRRAGIRSVSKISLLDVEPGLRLIEWEVVYHPRVPYFFWANWLKQGFRHVELWRRQPFGLGSKDMLWLVLKPTFEVLESYIDYDPTPPGMRFPDATIQRVSVLSRAYKVREWFAFGPPSCVETVKNALGINSFWTRTPHQLYQYIRRRGGILK